MARYVYGPVPSRRLGRSLGVDLVPLKTCSLNCVFCQLGRTLQPTIERAEYVPTDAVVEEVRERLREGVPLDYITLGGSGEPTLHSSFGIVAEQIRSFSRVPIALLTNGSLFYLPDVRAACRAISVILPTLDAGDEETFRRVHRPHPDLTLERIVQGLVALRQEYAGQIWLEVFLVPGLNTSDEEVRKIQAQIERIRPDRIDLNTAVRPPAEGFVKPVPPERLAQIRDMLGPKARVIAEMAVVPTPLEMAATAKDALEMIRRRPCTLEDIAAGLSIHPSEAVKLIQRLLAEGKVTEVLAGGRRFYRPR